MRLGKCCRKVVARTYASMALQNVDLGSLTARNDLHSCRQLLFWMAFNGLECLPLYADYLIRSFATSFSLAKSCQVFLRMSTATVYTWNAIIWAHVRHSCHEQAFVLFTEMQTVKCKPDRITFLFLLKVCCATHVFVEGNLIYAMVIETGYDLDLVVGSAIIHMYCCCAALDEAHKVFESLPNPNVVSWSALITGYSHHGKSVQALQLYEKLQSQGLQPVKSTILATLRACGQAEANTEGHLVHDQVIRAGLHADMAVASCLMDMYGKCGRLQELHKLFRDHSNHDVISWASFISAFAYHNGALNYFNWLQEMDEDAIVPDEVMFLCIIKASDGMNAAQSRIIHDRIIKAHFESNVAVANSVIDMYAKSGSLHEAEKMFKDIKRPNLVSYSSMISGYLQEGSMLMACRLFEVMQDEGIQPDKVIFLGALRAYSTLGSIRKGRQVHSYLMDKSLDTDVVVGNTVVDFYAKCGHLEEAHKVFDSLNKRDLVSWRVLICGYADQGTCMLAMVLMEQMQSQGFRADGAIFTSILASCSHAGLLEEACFYFHAMGQWNKIVPSISHYNCMLDLLGRAGHLVYAKDVLQTIPAASNFISWSSLLSGCKSHCDVNSGTLCFTELSHLDFFDASSFMLMSSIYSSVQLRYDANELQIVRRQGRAWKKPGEAWIEVGPQTYGFTVNDSLLQDHCFLFKSNRINLLMKLHGHLPDLDMLYEVKLSH